MRAARQFLICDSFAAAKTADAIVCQFLRERDGSKGSQWAGVSVRTDGVFGIFWDSPCLAVLGDPEKDPTLVLDVEVFSIKSGDEYETSNWSDYTPPPEPEGTP